MKVCKQCQIKFINKTKTQKFCSLTCVANSQKIGKYKMCKFCKSKMYVPMWEEKTKKFCSYNCVYKNMESDYIKTKCKLCKKIFKFKKFWTKTGTRKFCSVKCLCRYNNKTKKPFAKKMFTVPECKVKVILEKLNIKFEWQKQIPYKETFKQYDFYIPSENLLIEVDGVYWHGKNIKLKNMDAIQLNTHKNDLIKNKLAKQHGFVLKRLWEDNITENKIRNMICKN